MLFISLFLMLLYYYENRDLDAFEALNLTLMQNCSSEKIACNFRIR